MLSIGTISHGTLRSEDLAFAILDSLKSQGFDMESTLANELAAIATSEGRDEEHDWEVIHDGIDALNEFVPPFCYVGTHEGDGSDLGVWISEYAIQDAIHDGEVKTIADPSELDDIRDDCDFALFANDHGNMTLFDAETQETIWSVV